ncbi:MAG: flavin monoamine oxidase family protein [Solirubrobacteraceae bacterium]|nr:MAG: oxidoreductase [Solirubrobacterales bacterium]
MDSSVDLTRRGLLGAAAAGAAGLALPADSEAASKRGRKHKRKRHALASRNADVVVVGAGLAGLNAARQVVKAGRSAIVLEARNRVGGRTLNYDLGGGKVIEIGGQWIGPTQDNVAALASELGVTTYKTYNDGNYVFHRNGVNTSYTPTGPLGAIPPDYVGAADAEQALLKIDSMASSVPLEAPWTASSAGAWDAQTFETWKDANLLTDDGRFLLDLATEAVFAAEPRDVSLLWFLFYVHSAGNAANPGTIEHLINTAGGAQESRFHGGSQLISLTIAQQLGSRVVLNAPARRIEQSSSGVRVVSDAGSFSGSQAIVAMAPTLTGRLDYAPQLPAPRAQLVQRMPQGSVIKCEAIYDRPFWRDAGLAGQATSDLSPCRITFDNTPPDGSPGVMLGFIEGADARAYGRVPAAQRKAAVLNCFAAYYGAKALNPVGYVEMNWSEEEYTRGCYGGFTAPGVLTDYGEQIRAPFGRIHWCGAETATVWNGYMDGAVSSGARAAAEALAAL